MVNHSEEGIVDGFIKNHIRKKSLTVMSSMMAERTETWNIK